MSLPAGFRTQVFRPDVFQVVFERQAEVVPFLKQNGFEPLDILQIIGVLYLNGGFDSLAADMAQKAHDEWPEVNWTEGLKSLRNIIVGIESEKEGAIQIASLTNLIFQ